MASTRRARLIARILVPAGAVAIVCAGLVPAAASADPSTPTVGNDVLVLDQTPLPLASDNGPEPISLVTINTSGAPTGLPTVTLPTVAGEGGANNLPFTLSGTTNAGGFLSSSPAGVSLGGFDTAPNPTGSDPKKSTTITRVAGFVANDGTTDTSQAVTDASGGVLLAGGIRSVATDDGTTFFDAGNSGGGTDSGDTSGLQITSDGTLAHPADTGDSNFRTVQIVDGEVYATSDATATPGVLEVGSAASLATTPASSATNIISTSAYGSTSSKGKFTPDTPNGFALISEAQGASAPDTAYVLIEGVGIEKFADVSGAWTDEGKLMGVPNGSSTPEAVAARALPGGGAVVYTLSSAGTPNAQVLQVVDSSASDAMVDPSQPTVVYTAPSDTSLHGIALAPADWAPQAGNLPVNNPSGPSFTVTPAHAGLPLAEGVSSQPTSDDVQVTENDGTWDGDATVSADITSGQGVAASAVSIQGNGSAPGAYTLNVTPGTGVGYTTVVITANEAGVSQGQATVVIGQSTTDGALTDPIYLDGAADLSSAIDVGDGFTIGADDESNTLRLYDTSKSGFPVAQWDLDQPAPAGAGLTSEADFEASARIGNDVYWFGSFSDNKSSAFEPARDVIVKTTLSGSGQTTNLTVDGVYTNLRADIVSWAQANGDPDGLAEDCTTTGTQNNPDDTNGCNLEGVEIAPDGTTAYLGLRAPRAPNGDAIVIPLKNLPALIGASAGAAQFGTPFDLNLGGRTIREIRENAAGQYLITAGTPDDLTITPDWALYRWDGIPTDQPVLLNVSLPDYNDTAQTEGSGGWETILNVPADLDANGQVVNLVEDDGTTVFYGDGTAGKDITPMDLQKDVEATFTLPVPALTAVTPSISGVAKVGSELTAVPGSYPAGTSFSYQWLDGGSSIPGASSSTYTPTAAQAGADISVAVTPSQPEYGPLGAQTSTALTVAAATLSRGTASVTGTAKVGDTLAAHAGSWGPGRVTVRYQWYANGVKIAGATRTSLALTASQYAKKITVEVTGSESGYATATAISKATSTVAAGTLTHGRVTVAGTAKVGKRLVARAGSWARGAKLSYQWYASGRAIGHATSSSIVPGKGQTGTTITVRVTGRLAGYTTVTVASAATKKVAR